MDNYKLIKLFLILVKDLYSNQKYLNDDFYNNYEVSSRVCRNTLYKSGISINVEGLDNIPMEDPLLLAPNHISFFDIVLLLGVVDRPLPFAAATELTKYSVLKKYIEALNCVLIDRYTSDFKVVKEQIKNMGDTIKNTGLIVFPEGECSYNQEVYEFKKGSFLRVKEASIVPTYINMPNIKKLGRWVIPTSNVDVIFGKSFKVSEVFERSVSADVVAQYTRDKVLELKNKKNHL